MTTTRLQLGFFVAAGFVMATQVSLGRAPLGDAVWVAEVALFWTVVIAASLCVAASIAVLAVAHRRDLAEVGIIGGFLLTVSILPLVHGLTVPGVLYGDNAATMVSAAAAVPLGVVVATPLFAPAWAPARRLMRRWRAWTAAWGVAVSAFAVALLVDTELVAAPEMGSRPAIAVGVIATAGCFVLAVRQLRLSEISRHPGSVVMASAFVLIGTSALVWTGDRAFNAGFWFAHAVDIVGVLAGCAAAVIAYRVDGSLRRLVDPVVSVEPTSALELGLDPVVHRFVALLDAKDPQTRDHVVRCAELVMRVGPRLGVHAGELRDLGIAAILHDVGKLETPDEILTKPGRLTDAELQVMRTHAAIGADLALASPVLAGAAPGIRGHHERWDGEGYPDRLATHEIPRHARIVSVCDAFDAMAYSRHYREGMGVDRALAILREHAGSQWDPEVVDAVCAVVGRDGPADGGGALASVGRGEPAVEAFCGCADALPAGVSSGGG